jgi:hypothetical protein
LFKTYAAMANPSLAATSGMAPSSTAIPSFPQAVDPTMQTMGQITGQPKMHGDDRYMPRFDMTRGEFGDLRDQFRDDRSQWRDDGRLGPRPVWRNYLMPDGPPASGGIVMPQPQPMPAPAPTPAAPYGGVGTGLGVAGATMPANPYAIPGYGG